MITAGSWRTYVIARRIPYLPEFEPVAKIAADALHWWCALSPVKWNKFAQWAYFGADTIAENVRDDQVKIIKYNHLIANLVIFHNCHTITLALKDLEAKGWELTPELIAMFSPFRTHHLNRFGQYDLQERDPDPVDYSIRLNVGTR